MRKCWKVLIILVLALVCMLSLGACSVMKDIPTFDDIQDYTKEDFEIYLRGAKREDIIQVWGEPNGTISEENADMWVLDDERVLTISFDKSGKFKDAGIGIQETGKGECLELPDIVVPNGSYSLFFKCPPTEDDTQWAMPVLTLSATDETFVFSHYSGAANGFSSGAFEIDGDVLICKADDGKQYIFTISDTDTLCYIKEGSADLEVFEVSYLSHEEGEKVTVEDGATFLRQDDVTVD